VARRVDPEFEGATERLHRIDRAVRSLDPDAHAVGIVRHPGALRRAGEVEQRGR
jgi:hypothetical protein